MGSDDLYKKRKERAERNFSRIEEERALYTNVLVVCEGETETLYLQELAQSYNLNSKRIQIIPCSTGTDPLNIVKQSLYLNENSPSGFKYIYCVFDGAGNTNLDAALTLIKKHKSDGFNIQSIVSYPCFEYWILMHYSNSTRPLSDDNGTQKEIKKHINDYKKGMKGLFEKTKADLQTAIRNSRSTLKQAQECENLDPSTQIHELITHLIKISEEEKSRQ
jgi:hypothetical protein